MTPRDEKEWQKSLDYLYLKIETVAKKYDNDIWLHFVRSLKSQSIRPARWIVRKLWPKSTIATVIHPPFMADGIDLFDLFWEKTDAVKCSILTHEAYHLMQRKVGNLNYIRYVTSKSYRDKVEKPAYEEQYSYYSFHVKLFGPL